MSTDINTVYKEYTDCSDNSALENVIRSGDGIVRHFAALYGKGLDYDDLYQAGMIGLLRAVKTYKNDCDTSFSTWASECITSEIRHYARSERKYHCPVAETDKEANTNSSQSTLQDSSGLLHLSEIDVNKLCNSQTFQLELEDKLTLEQAMEKLSGQQRKVLNELYYKGLTQQQTADRLGLSQRCVSRIKCAAVKILRQLLDPSSFHLVDNSKSFHNISNIKKRAIK